MIGLAGAVVTFLVSFLLRPAPRPPRRAQEIKQLSVLEVARLPGLRATFFVSVVTVAAQDLIVVYLPLLGKERGLSVDTIGMLLTVRAIASMSSRFLFSRLNKALGPWTLIIVSTFIGAVSYAALALPLPLLAMHAAVAVSGFTLGVAVTGSIAGALALSTPETRGTANSLRMMGNRMGQMIIPFLAGLIATSSGAGSIFLIIGLSLAASATSIKLNRANIDDSDV
jgi:predicted MFS family arabinose efflux permease